ncbi:MAG: ADP-ribosylglycohydrolase family protein [bacterium]|nr:ADP-ribosylglycohydrolase family protein [bacterium]
MPIRFTRDKIEGMFLGVAIGDALGMPVEMMSLEDIAAKHGRIEEYLKPKGHTWFGGKLKAGMWTDDTQLTLAVAESLIARGCIDLDDLAKAHIAAMKQSVVGWGKSTRNSVKRLDEGVHWSVSGEKAGAGNGGTGNGVVMKISPIAACIAANYMLPDEKRWTLGQYVPVLQYFVTMTHATRMALVSAMAHIGALNYCLQTKTGFSRNIFKVRTCYGALIGDQTDLDPDRREQGNMVNRLRQLMAPDWTTKTAKEIALKFGRGSCYVYNSLPFSYAFFLKAHDSIETLYEAVSAGGDTDTNGSIVGGLLGALNGKKIFPQSLVDGLWQKDRIFDTARDFCKKFQIPD